MKLLLIGDIHYGEHGNSEKYNQQVNNFVDWVCEKFVGTVDKTVQLGDWYHHRNQVNVSTLGYGIAGAKKLANAFGKENTFVLSGNHDLYYLDRLDVSSLAAIEAYVTVVDELTHLDDKTLLAPWIANDEMWSDLVEKSEEYEYVLGHFEFNSFKMNAHYEMVSGRSHKELQGVKRIISGHYHSKQEKDNVVYAGTPFPITFSEANQPHGVFVLDTETNELEFYEYDVIKVLSIPYDQIALLKDLDVKNTRVRLEFPSDLEDEGVIGEMMDQLVELGFEGSKTQYKGKKLERLLENTVEVNDIEDIDSNIVKAIRDIDVEGIDKEMLESLYTQSIGATQ